MKPSFCPRIEALLWYGIESMEIVESMRHAGDPIAELKDDRTPVTDIDLCVEQFLRRSLIADWPNDGIIGEEFGGHILDTDSRFRWLIDPIDGTEALARGVPLFGVQIALADGLEVVGGGVFFPGLGVCIIAEKGLGAWCLRLDQRVWSRACVSDVADFSSTKACFTSAEHWFTSASRGELFTSLAMQCRSFRGWGDAFGYFLVATGRADLMIDASLKLWDIAPWVVILREAGGEVLCVGGPLEGVVIGVNRGLFTNGAFIRDLRLDPWNFGHSGTSCYDHGENAPK